MLNPAAHAIKFISAPLKDAHSLEMRLMIVHIKQARVIKTKASIRINSTPIKGLLVYPDDPSVKRCNIVAARNIDAAITPKYFKNFLRPDVAF
jgi:hypothetical protein